MTRTNGEDRARTTNHRDYPIVTGLGVAAALLMVRWFPLPRSIAFTFLPMVIAVGIVGILSFWRRQTRGSKLAARPIMVAWTAAGGATVIALSPFLFLSGLRIFTVDWPVVETDEFLAVVASVGALSGWFSFVFAHLAESRDADPGSRPARGITRLWATSGITIFLALSTFPAWAYAALPFGGIGPGMMWALYAVALGIVGFGCLVVGVVAEAVLALMRRPSQ